MNQNVHWILSLPNWYVEVLNPHVPILETGLLTRCVSCSVMSDSFATPWTIARQAPLSVEFSSQEYWSGLPFPTPGDLPNPGIEPTSPALAGSFFSTELCGKLLADCSCSRNIFRWSWSHPFPQVPSTLHTPSCRSCHLRWVLLSKSTHPLKPHFPHL